jgi:hypothetical protein
VASNHTVGSKIIPQGLTKYTALMLTKKKYGEKGLSEELERLHNDYRFGRGFRNNFQSENDLLHANRWFLYSAKPALALYGLQGLIGEDSLDAALRSFREQYAFRDGGPYAGVDDLYQTLAAHVPDSVKYFLEDSWKSVCLYDNRLLTASSTALKDGYYKVILQVQTGKTYFDSTGKEHPATDMNDYIDIGIDGQTSPGIDRQTYGGRKSFRLYFHRYRLTAGIHQLEITVKGHPAIAQIDPGGFLLDYQYEDNRKELP